MIDNDDIWLWLGITTGSIISLVILVVIVLIKKGVI